jgi:hypothetical protein
LENWGREMHSLRPLAETTVTWNIHRKHGSCSTQQCGAQKECWGKMATVSKTTENTSHSRNHKAELALLTASFVYFTSPISSVIKRFKQNASDTIQKCCTV